MIALQALWALFTLIMFMHFCFAVKQKDNFGIIVCLINTVSCGVTTYFIGLPL